MKISNPIIRGFYSGLIAGCIGGLFYILFTIPETILGLPGNLARTLDIFELYIFVTILGYSVPANGIWGSIYGIVYSRFYDGVPGKGIKKGFVWGCIIAFISNVMLAFYTFLALLFTSTEFYFILTYSWIESGFMIWVSYGIFFGILYERWK